MKQHKFIVSNSGFLKEIVHNKIEIDFIWTQKIRDAKIFTTKTAKDTIDKYQLNCWIWNPYEEEYETSYKVIRRSNFIDYMTYETINVLDWFVEKVKIINSDINYLTNKNNNEKYYDFDTATNIANNKNAEILIEIMNKINYSKLDRNIINIIQSYGRGKRRINKNETF